MTFERSAPGHIPAFASLRTLAGLRDEKKVSSADIIRDCLARIDALNERSKAFISVDREGALAQAEALDRTREGVLCGLPYAVKDLFDVAGQVTTAGSRVFADRQASEDAESVARLRRAGAICLGKLNLHEFAYGATGENQLYGTPVNAYDHQRLAGGSSSGSAAAVAFGMVPAALGTDTGGSVRAPAALNGLVGLKPTLGLISTRGVIPYCWSLDHLGCITRSAADAALLLSVLAGHDPLDPASADVEVQDYPAALAPQGRLEGVTIGIPRVFYFERCDPQILAASEAVLKHLERRGARLLDVELPSMERARSVSLTIQMPEALSYHMPHLEARGDLYSEEFRAGLALGQCILAEHYVRARRMLTLYRQQVDSLFQEVDALLTPATPVVAPPLGSVRLGSGADAEPVGNAITRYTTFFNMTGHPAMTLPAGLHGTGLPMGVQLVARHFDEALLFRLASCIESAPEFALPPPNP